MWLFGIIFVGEIEQNKKYGVLNVSLLNVNFLFIELL